MRTRSPTVLGRAWVLCLLATFGGNGCSDSGAHLGGDDDQDVPSDTDVHTDDAGPADDGIGADDGGFGEDGGWGDDGTGGCECLDPLDECVYERCVRTAYTCNALHACDPGYECGPDSRCRCIDSDVCGIRCDRTGYCPEDPIGVLICASDGVCRPALPCIADAMCPSGELCIGNGGDHAICAVPGPAGVSASCAENTDCAEGVCETGVCLHRCRLNSDCAPGLLCGDTRQGQLGCMVATGCTSCSGAGQYCWLAPRCRDSNCVTSADCPGNCYFELRSPTTNAGECMGDPVPLACADDEFASMMAMEQCFIHRACRTAADCGAPYECVPHVTVEGVGFCGRTP